MSLGYRLLYAVGFTPWERMVEAPAAEQIARAFAREEERTTAPFGRALDLGCGSGIWSVELAGRGWDVTGVDFVPKALRRARDRAEERGVQVRFIAGDVTALTNLDAGSGYRLLLDFGCFHDELTDAQRRAEAREATALAEPGATLLISAFKPGRRGPLPRGASAEDIQAAFHEWELVDDEQLDVTGAPGWVRKAEPRLYQLRLGSPPG
jgi:SAM-dependent methyltransferase